MQSEQQAENPNSEALSWLLEFELVQTPHVLNSMILNVFRILPGLKDAQFVIDLKTKKLLIYLELTWFSKHFKKQAIYDQALDIFDEILPTFKKRITFDRTILEKAIELSKR